MAKYRVTGPDGATYEVNAPDGASDQDVMAYVQSQAQQPAPAQPNPAPPPQPTQAPQGYGETYTGQAISGANEGLANTLGFPVDMMNGAMGIGARGVNAVAGTNLRTSDKPFLGSQMLKDIMAPAISPPSTQSSKQFARRVGQEVGAAAIPAVGVAAKAPSVAASGARSLAAALGSGTGAATAQQVFPGNPLAEIAGQLIGGLAPSAIESGLRRFNAPKPTAPSVDDLKAKAGALYDKAEASGVTAPQAETQKLAAEIRAVAHDEGLISSTGKVSTAYPKVASTIDTFDDYAQGAMTVKQMKAARKTLTNMAKSSDAAESRIGGIMLEKLDDFTSPLSAELEAARGVYHSAKKGEMIDTAIELAGSRAGQFTGSGFENALRTEFRQLERKAIKGQLKGLSQEELAAISKVAQGGPVVNALRTLGKLAPTGPVSFMAGGGLPFAVGNAVGGPAMGAAVAGTSMGTGFAARSAATAMQSRNANLAGELMRGGAPKVPPTPYLNEGQIRSLAAILAGQAANAQASGSKK